LLDHPDRLRFRLMEISGLASFRTLMASVIKWCLPWLVTQRVAESEESSLVVTMKKNPEEIRSRVAAHRARQIVSGRVALNTYVPGDLVEAIDKIKEQRGVSGRAPIIEEALRFYIEKQQGA
jgi:hypothetical protein